MESIRELYKIGHGPSSSHTMGPRNACHLFLNHYPDAPKYVVTLFGSLAATGKGHLTGVTVEEAFKGKQLDLIWRADKYLDYHPNAMQLIALNEDGSELANKIYFSIGGGSIVEEGEDLSQKESVYSLSHMDDILKWCDKNERDIWEYVEHCEGKEIWTFLEQVWEVMVNAIKKGCSTDGVLPGGLNIKRKAMAYKSKSKTYSGPIKETAKLFSYAHAVSEENASGGLVVTAPTCGACGILPAVLYYHKKVYKCAKKDILRALATAGLIGNIIKTNASISGAEVGCQGEVGVACAMASGAATQIHGGTIYQIENSAEMGLEHHLGLTCDPVLGLVQIPCIERNVLAAARAISHNTYAMMGNGKHRISLDDVTETMLHTGRLLDASLKETSKAGLAILKSMKYYNGEEY
ncbi:MAG: L-serine ammonia-lyase [Mangrovibacterium sp.]